MSLFRKYMRPLTVLLLCAALIAGSVSVSAAETGNNPEAYSEAAELDVLTNENAAELLTDLNAAVSSDRSGAALSDYNGTVQGGGLAIPHYSQITTVTNGDPYNIGIDLGYACAAFCMAMVQSYFLDRYVSPTAIWEDYAFRYTNQNNNGYAGGNGNAIFMDYFDGASAGMPSCYVPATYVTTTLNPNFKENVITAVKANHPVIIQTKGSVFSTGEHFVVVRGFEEVEEEIEEESSSSSEEESSSSVSESSSSASGSSSSSAPEESSSAEPKTRIVTYYYVNDPAEGYNGKDDYEGRKFTEDELLGGANTAYIFPAASVTRYNDPNGRLFYDRTENSVSVSVLQGSDRYQTAAYIARKSFPSGAQSIVLATGEKFPDALAANAYAGAVGAPLLLSDTDELSFETANLLANVWHYQVTEVTIIGRGFSDQVIQDLESFGIPKSGIHVIGGANRIETAEAICQALLKKVTVDTAIIATGETPADALSASSYCYSNYVPVLLAKSDGTLSDETRKLLEAHPEWKILVLGGESRIKDSALDGLIYTRISGDDRYATNQAFIKYVEANGGLNESAVCYAMGADRYFPDALTGGMLAGQSGSPIVLVSKTSTDVFEAERKRASDSGYFAYVLGAAGSCSGLMAALPSLLRY